MSRKVAKQTLLYQWIEENVEHGFEGLIRVVRNALRIHLVPLGYDIVHCLVKAEVEDDKECHHTARFETAPDLLHEK
jgi:hypothetical protein